MVEYLRKKVLRHVVLIKGRNYEGGLMFTAHVTTIYTQLYDISYAFNLQWYRNELFGILGNALGGF